MRPSKYIIGPALSPSLIERVERAFDGENLIETILHAHLLIEHLLTTLVAKKLVKLEILNETQWSFHQKLSLYIGLYDPPQDRVRRIRGFNRLRNAIAHSAEEVAETAVVKYLPWERERPTDPERPRPDALSQ